MLCYKKSPRTIIHNTGSEGYNHQRILENNLLPPYYLFSPVSVPSPPSLFLAAFFLFFCHVYLLSVLFSYINNKYNLCSRSWQYHPTISIVISRYFYFRCKSFAGIVTHFFSRNSFFSCKKFTLQFHSF